MPDFTLSRRCGRLIINAAYRPLAKTPPSNAAERAKAEMSLRAVIDYLPKRKLDRRDIK